MSTESAALPSVAPITDVVPYVGHVLSPAVSFMSHIGSQIYTFPATFFEPIVQGTVATVFSIPCAVYFPLRLMHTAHFIQRRFQQTFVMQQDVSSFVIGTFAWNMLGHIDGVKRVVQYSAICQIIIEGMEQVRKIKDVILRLFTEFWNPFPTQQYAMEEQVHDRSPVALNWALQLPDGLAQIAIKTHTIAMCVQDLFVESYTLSGLLIDLYDTFQFSEETGHFATCTLIARIKENILELEKSPENFVRSLTAHKDTINSVATLLHLNFTVESITSTVTTHASVLQDGITAVKGVYSTFIEGLGVAVGFVTNTSPLIGPSISPPPNPTADEEHLGRYYNSPCTRDVSCSHLQISNETHADRYLPFSRFANREPTGS